MNKAELEALGITPEDVTNKLVEKLFDHFAGGLEDSESDFTRQLQKHTKDKIDSTIAELFEQRIAPGIKEKVETVCLQETNKWGESVGKPVTFIEYLTQRADSYIREPVNHNGKTQIEDSYSWRKDTTRISHLIHEHLKYSISKAMVDALGLANASVRKGLEEAVNTALKNIKVTVDTTVKSL